MNEHRLNQQDVNKIAKYIYNHTDGAKKISFGPNYVDIYMTVYYHTGQKDDPVQEMDLDINMTSYSQKIRYNVTEMTATENTFLHGTLEVKDPSKLEEIRKAIYNRIIMSIEEEFEEYDFVF